MVNLHLRQQRRMVCFGIVVENPPVISFALRRIATSSQEP